MEKKILDKVEQQQKDILIQIQHEKEKAFRRRLNLPIPAEKFAELFRANCAMLMLKQNNDKDFVVDQAKDVINQLFYYATQDSRFKGSFDKGILLIGKYGVGKTLIMTAFCNLLTSLNAKKITIEHSKKIVNDVMKDPDLIYSLYSKYWLMIDDLGKEPYSVTTYGTQTMPMEDVLSARYDGRSITLATANLRISDFKYSDSIKERMKEMLNVIEFKGKSMR